MSNDTDKIKQLREKTFAGMMDCKRALAEAGGDIKKAIEILRKKGIALAGRKAARVAKEGIIASYIHSNDRIGVLIEVNCETDFVAKNDLFKNFVKDLTMQVAASNPLYIDKKDIPKEVVDKEIDIIKEQHKDKPAKVMDKIIEGNLDKFYSEVCLLHQPFIKDPSVTIKDLLTQIIAKTGENIAVHRFTRYQLGEET